jgi:hypothetical protein
MASDRMINKLQRSWKEIVVANLRHYPNICLEPFGIIMKPSIKRAGFRSEI